MLWTCIKRQKNTHSKKIHKSAKAIKHLNNDVQTHPTMSEQSQIVKFSHSCIYIIYTRIPQLMVYIICTGIYIWPPSFLLVLCSCWDPFQNGGVGDIKSIKFG